MLKTLLLSGALMVSLASMAEAKTILLNLTNNTPNYITNLTVVPANGATAPLDLVGQRGLAVGKSLEMELPGVADTCVFDFSITYANGVTEQRKNADLCAQPTVIIEIIK